MQTNPTLVIRRGSSYLRHLAIVYIFVSPGVIQSYRVSVRDSSGTDVSSFMSTTTSVVATPLSCCADYTVQVSARTSAGEGAASQVGNFRTEGQYNATSKEEIFSTICVRNTMPLHSLPDPFRVSTSARDDTISVSWMATSSIVQQQLRSIRIILTPECQTTTSQQQVFVTAPTEGNSRNVTGLGNVLVLGVL